MVIISDTTVISNLAQINELDLLKTLYSEVIIPKSVRAELQTLIDGNTIPEEILIPEWLVIKAPINTSKVGELLNTLDLGESEAIALSLELKADYLLIDEKQGRLVAVENNIKVIGTLGILLEAKNQKLINSVKDKMDQLKAIGFWISNSIYQKVIELEKGI
jgi:uncharacterized protein